MATNLDERYGYLSYRARIVQHRAGSERLARVEHVNE
jgi:hypothetical protein